MNLIGGQGLIRLTKLKFKLNRLVLKNYKSIFELDINIEKFIKDNFLTKVN